MSIYLKQDSITPTFSTYLGVGNSQVPQGYIEITEQQRQELQDAIDSNPSGAVVNGLWVPS